jgi:hypothetical protein
MAKVPSIDTEIKIDAEAHSRLTAGSDASLQIAGAANPVPVRVLDAFNAAKQHQVAAGDEAFVVFLLIDHPKVSYESVTRGVAFDVLDNGRKVGSGKVLSRVDL